MINIGTNHQEGAFRLAETKRVTCQEHTRERAVGVCQTHGCANKVFCSRCQSNHSNHHCNDIDDFIGDTAQRIRRHGHKNYQDLLSLKANKDYSYIFKYLQDSDQHLRRVDDHYKAQKMLLQEDIDTLANGFIAICHNIKDSIG